MLFLFISFFIIIIVYFFIKSKNIDYFTSEPAPTIQYQYNNKDIIQSNCDISNISFIDSADQFIKQYSTLDSSITNIFTDYTRPSNINNVEINNFNQFDVYLENVPKV